MNGNDPQESKIILANYLVTWSSYVAQYDGLNGYQAPGTHLSLIPSTGTRGHYIWISLSALITKMTVIFSGIKEHN